MSVYTYNRSVNSDRLTEEVAEFLSQVATEHSISLDLNYIVTVGLNVSIHVSGTIPEEEIPNLDSLVGNHDDTPFPTDPLFPEYSGNAEAKAGGLVDGQLYRTGEFVKVVYS